jgi:hypothetical protein
VFVPGKPFQPSRVFAGKTGEYLSEAPDCLQVGPEPTRVKHLSGAALYGRLLALPSYTRLGWKGLPGDKHSSLLRKSVNYGRNKGYDTGPRGLVRKSRGLYCKHFYGCNCYCILLNKIECLLMPFTSTVV